MTTPHESTCPPGVLGWIPWYPEGLADEQRGAVESHAAECAVCRDEIAFLQGDAEPPADVPDPERIYAQVLARIESNGSESGRGASTAPGVRAAVAPRRGWRRLEMRPALRLAASVLVALAVGTGVGSWISGSPEPVYETAMAAEADDPATGASLDVVFREDVGAQRISQVLRELDAQITSGPSQVGVYRLGLPADADVTAAAKLLMGDRGIAILAEKSRQP